MPTQALNATAELSPTVSVAEAMGLPKDWSLQESLGNGKAEKDEAAEEAEETVAETEEPAVEEKAAEETPEEKLAKAQETKPEAKTKEKAPAKEKPAAKEKAPAKEKAAAKPAPKAEAVPEKPAVKEPEEKAAEPTKIKIGDKFYTQEELQEKLAKAEAAAAPASTAQPKKELTAEEQAAQQKEIERKDNEWIEKTATALAAPLDDKTLDVILGGGKEAVEALQKIRQTDMARAVLVARKSMYADLQPVLDDLRAQQAPLVSRQMQEADEKEWNTFSTTYPTLANHRKAVETIANALVEREPDRIGKMTMAEFQAEVAKQTKALMKETFGVDVDAQAPAKKEPEVENPAAKETEQPEEKKEAPVTKRAAVKPPPANVPTPTPGKGGKGGKGSDSDIINSLW